MNVDRRSCWIERAGTGTRLHLGGNWNLPSLRRHLADLNALDLPVASVTCVDGAALEAFDTSAALLLLRALGPAADSVTLSNFDPRHASVLELVRARTGSSATAPEAPRWTALARLGREAHGFVALLVAHLNFFGLVATEIGRLALAPGRLRVRELFAQLNQVGVTAIPVVALVTFLIGVVIAYLLGLQAEQYGASIFVVDGVSLGLTREFAPILVATIIAGRSGAAFTAQLGTMKLTEEIDAIRTLGLSPEQVLILPRILALVLSLPLLVFVGDVFGLFGAMLICDGMLGIPPDAFIERLQLALMPRHFVIGLLKAPVFALFIGIVGCRMGLAVSRDTRSIGINTTSTVVQSIVGVILIDAFFAIVLQGLGL